MATFPEFSWFEELCNKLNQDEQYNRIAQKWEGDFLFTIEPGGAIKQPIHAYIDLWHGKCRAIKEIKDPQEVKASFVLSAPYPNYVTLLKGNIDPMQAMLTRKLKVQGNMAVLMRSIPTVLDFVRCCREVTDGFLGEAPEK
jgi:putative sterol carrier protein